MGKRLRKHHAELEQIYWLLISATMYNPDSLAVKNEAEWEDRRGKMMEWLWKQMDPADRRKKYKKAPHLLERVPDLGEFERRHVLNLKREGPDWITDAYIARFMGGMDPDEAVSSVAEEAGIDEESVRRSLRRMRPQIIDIVRQGLASNGLQPKEIEEALQDDDVQDILALAAGAPPKG
jgi:DNA-binding phage protein